MRDQIASARAAGVHVWGYWWPYAGQNQREVYHQAVDMAQGCELLWPDIEAYTDGRFPNADECLQIFDEMKRNNAHPSLYTGPWMWEKLGRPNFGPEVWLWNANYNNKADLVSVPSYGGMTQVGHQYTSTPIDLDVFDAALLKA